MFYKEKGFYISLACGIVAVIALAVICYSLMGGTGDGDGDGDVDMVTEATASPSEVPTKEPASTATVSQAVEKKPKKTAKPKATKEPEEKTVETDANPINNLHFDQEMGLLWPIKGDILMEYSADQVVYFKTLAQYRTNPAILIAAKEGQEVKASADGVVSDIISSEETGRTLVVDIGNDFSVSYGQLMGITVQKGDTVTEGQVIGKVAKPTSYYSEEGTNLYFQVKEKDAAVNPMLLLR